MEAKEIEISDAAVAEAATDMRTRGIANRTDRRIADMLEALAADRDRIQQIADGGVIFAKMAMAHMLRLEAAVALLEAEVGRVTTPAGPTTAPPRPQPAE